MRKPRSFALLLACLSLLLASLPAFAAGETTFFPKRLLVNNDGTNMFWRDDLTLEMVKRRAAECPDAVTTYLLCPNSIQKMMYPSDLEEMSQRGALPELVKAGEDPFGLFLSELKTRKMEVFITYRMNEVHNVDKDDPDLSKFWRDHPDWRVESGAPLGNWMAQCLDYAHNEVQDRAVAQMCELLEKYRPDGIELDWMRFPRHLSGDAEKVWSNRGMLTDVVAAVKLKADELAGRLGRPVRVAVRIPSSMAGCRALGVDLADWTQRKLVDFVTAAPFLSSDFSMPLEEMRPAMGDAKVPIYGCIEFGYSGKPHSEATLHAAALGLYESGVDGIYLFNFPCWRETQEAPPWSWVPQLKDPALLTCNTLEFPLINGTNRAPNIDLPAPLPVTLQPGEAKMLSLTLPKAAVSGFEKVMKAKLACEPAAGFESKLNGEVSGKEGAVSATAVHPGENTLELRNTGTESVTVTEVRLALDLPAVPPTVFPDLPEGQCIHISPQGSDKNPGTLELPVQSLMKAIGHVATANSTPACIWVHAGAYKFGNGHGFGLGPFDPGDSMPREDNLYVRAWPGDKVVFSNGIVLMGWKPAENGLWTMPYKGDIGELYVNGKRAKRAQGDLPDGAELWGDTEHIDAAAGYRLPNGSMAAWKNARNVCLGYFNSWAHMTCPVDRIDKDGDGGAIIIMRQPSFYLGLHKEGVQLGQPAYIENALELLNEPGEWYHDSKRQVLHYMPREGEDMMVANVTEGGASFLFSHTAHTWFEGVTFADSGLAAGDRNDHMDMQANFTMHRDNRLDGARLIERDGKLAVVHNEYAQSNAGVEFFCVNDCRFINCTFTRMDGAGVNVDAGSKGVIFDNCLFEDIGQSAIQIGGVNQMDHHPPNPDHIARNHIVANCTIRNCGVEFEGSVGIFVGYANGTVISHNEIYDLTYSGVSVGWGWGEEDAGGGAYPIPFTYAMPTPCGANRIEYNHIHNVMQKRYDGGAVYMLGNQPGTVIRGNYLHDNGPGNPGGIYLDEGSGYMEITGNAVHDCANPMNYNNAAQDRKATCFEHDNTFGPTPGDKDFPEDVAKRAGPEKR